MTAAASIPEPFAPRLRRHLFALLRLAWPVVLSRAGILVMAIADLVMVSRHSTGELAAFSIGLAIFVPVMVAGVGLMLGAVSIISRQEGRGDRMAAAETWRRALAWGLVVGTVAAALLWFTESILALFGQSPVLVTGGGAVGRVLAIGALAQILFVVCAFYLEGTGRSLPSLIAMIFANLLNLWLNDLLIPLESWAGGAVGAAIGSTIARLLIVVALVAWILRDAEARAALRAAGHWFWGPGGWAGGAEMRRIGWAGGMAHMAESVAFASLAQAAGLISVGALAAYSIAHNVEATAFMAGLGVAIATGVRVGAEHGAGRPDEAAFAGWTGLGAVTAMMVVIGVSMNVFADGIAAIYTSDAAIASRIAPLFLIVAVSLVFDGGQIVMAQSTRALGDTWPTVWRLLISFFLVMIPLGWILAFTTSLAERGLFLATAAGCIVAVVLLAIRFRTLVAQR